MSEYYTVIRVKRKLIDDDDNKKKQDLHDSSICKRLRHIGSFSRKHDEVSLNSENILKKMGFRDQKRIVFNDFEDSEQFSSYAQNLKKKIKINDQNNHSDLENDIFKISLPPNDSLERDIKNKVENNSIIICNGDALTPINNIQDQTHKDKYLYDYYILCDDLMDFGTNFDNKEDEYPNDDEPSSNDENYRYNDYPDEDEFSVESDDDEEEANYNENFDAYEEIFRDSKDICVDFDDLYLDSEQSSNDNYGDDEYVSEYEQNIMKIPEP